MPEGDTVWLTAARLQDGLAGGTLDRWELRVPAAAGSDLRGRPVTQVLARGKHLLIRIGETHTLHSHLRMEGAWRLYPRGQRWRGGPGWQIRAILGVPGLDAVGYRLGLVELLPRQLEGTAVGHLGPDLLGPDWDPALAVANLLAAPEQEIGLALLDQRNLAGLGNLYRNEVAFLRGVHPRTPAGQVAGLPALVDLAHRLLLANRNRWDQITTGQALGGPSQWVFERTGAPCLRCRTPIEATGQGRPPRVRLTYWCPSCQPAPSGAGGGRLDGGGLLG